MKLPSAERVRELFDYDPATGTMTRRGTRIPVGEPTANGYGSIWIGDSSYLTHRLAWVWVHGVWPVGDMDHKDGNPRNNALENLRVATRTQNLANRCRNRGKPWPKGVSPHSTGFRARIRHEGKLYNLGTFATVEEASAAYLAKAKELFGEFARAA